MRILTRTSMKRRPQSSCSYSSYSRSELYSYSVSHYCPYVEISNLSSIFVHTERVGITATLYTCIPEAPDSKLSRVTDYTDSWVSWFSWRSPIMCRVSALKYATTVSLPNYCILSVHDYLFIAFSSLYTFLLNLIRLLVGQWVSQSVIFDHKTL